MRLRFSGNPEIPASTERVWQLLLDPHFIAASLPGVERVQVSDPTHFSVVSGLGIGLFKLRFALDVEFFELVERTGARMRAHGTAPGSKVEMHSSIRLEELGPARVRLHWEADSRMTGAVTGIGSRLIEGAVRRLTELFWHDFARRAAARAGV